MISTYISLFQLLLMFNILITQYMHKILFVLSTGKSHIIIIITIVYEQAVTYFVSQQTLIYNKSLGNVVTYYEIDDSQNIILITK